MKRTSQALGSLLSALLLASCKPHPQLPPPGPPKPTASAQAPHPAQHAMAVLPASVAEWAHGARRFAGLGSFHRSITTAVPEAQAYFDQGMRLLWAFNHDESTRSFAKAAELDPQCAICYWGVALTVGPNYNLPMMAKPRAKVAAAALALAQRNAPHASALEQALIGALATRYPNDEPLDPSNSAGVLKAYAAAMRKIAAQYRDDLDVQTLFAESLMTVNAWKLWAVDGTPAPGTPEIRATLERVLAKNPDHPGANHYYMHTMEASSHPELAVAAAERVTGMMPAAGHLEHMPAHILQRVGRYEEAAEANRKGAAADDVYFKSTQAPDYYTMYQAHNYQFLAYSAAMEGRRSETLEAVGKARRAIPDEMVLAMPGMDWMLSEEYAARLRFGLWDEMLKLPAPNPKLVALSGGYLYGRAVALAAKGEVSEAKRTLAQLDALIAQVPAEATAAFNPAHDVLGLARTLGAARIASAEKRTDDSLQLLRDAVRREDRLSYDEPKDWFFPVRHELGAALLAAGKPKEAEATYREDLRREPANGWSLYGLAAALRAQRKPAEQVDQDFKKAWQHADIELTASAF